MSIIATIVVYALSAFHPEPVFTTIGAVLEVFLPVLGYFLGFAISVELMKLLTVSIITLFTIATRAIGAILRVVCTGLRAFGKTISSKVSMFFAIVGYVGSVPPLLPSSVVFRLSIFRSRARSVYLLVCARARQFCSARESLPDIEFIFIYSVFRIGLET
jgi:hypothetical protein